MLPGAGRAPRPIPPHLGNSLVCRDAATGKILWRAGSKRMVAAAVEGRTRFLASPVFSQGRVYVPALVGADVCLLCLGGESGTVLFRTKLASVPARQS